MELENAGQGTAQTEPGAQPAAAQGALPEPPAVDPAKPEKLFSRDEVNKIIHAEVQKALGAFQQSRDEAEKLSRMQESERMQYEKEQAEKRAEEALGQLGAYRLREEARKLADKEGLPSALLDWMDFGTLTAEQVGERIPQMSKAFGGLLEQELGKRLQQKPPATHAPGGGSEYDALLLKAQEAGDMTAVAYYTRMKATQNRS